VKRPRRNHTAACMVRDAPFLIRIHTHAMLLGVFVCTFVAVAYAAEDPSSTVSNVIAIEVGLVRVTTTRPGTDQTWAIPSRPAKDNNSCEVILGAAAVAAAPGAGWLAIPVIKELCSDPGSAPSAHSATDPNIYVRLSSDRMSFRSYTVAKTRSHSFKFRTVIPVAGIPRAGLVVEVVNDDRSGNEESKETIGHIRISPKRLIDAAENGIPIEERDGGIEKIEIIVTPVDAKPRVKSQTVDVLKGLALLEDFPVSAGEVVEVQSHGAYYAAGRAEPVTATGYMGRGATYPDAPFATAPLGSGMLRVGKRGLMKGYVVAPCANFISPYEALLAVGINNGLPGAARGDLKFDVTVRPATVAEWQNGSAAPCTPATEAKNTTPAASSTAMADKVGSQLTSLGDKLAQAIIGRLHPTGVEATLKSVEMRSTPAATFALITSDWHGGFVGNAYTTTVRWEFNSERHIGTFLVRDTAEITTSTAGQNALDIFFSSKLYPVLVKH
jgi:hypothetical protein